MVRCTAKGDDRNTDRNISRIHINRAQAATLLLAALPAGGSGNRASNKIWGKVLYIVIAVAAIVLIVTAFGGYTQKEPLPLENETLIKEKIKSELIGLEVTYRGKWGEIEKYTINESDIKMINETQLNGKRAWKVRIGEGMAWDYYFDEKGENIVNTVQLFRN